ncbi:MAG TPA: tetratricopeptide repeat protein [Roseiflexaceae bacterium]|nr:tetratricopeptide repeat protein [Roseiflexaceae bacterium]
MRSVLVDLTLGRASGTGFSAEVRMTVPGSATQVSPLLLPAPVALDLAQLRARMLDPGTYGRALSAMLFADGALRSAFAQARAVAAQQLVPLRLCLTIRPEANELHALRWECLADPDAPDRPLAAGGQVLLSRTLPSADWSALAPRPAGPLRAVALVAAPADLAAYDLSPIDAAQEIAQIQAQLGGCALTVLGDRTLATLPTLLGQLHAGCDLLLVLAHGRTDQDGQTWLYLEDAAGDTAPTPGSALVAQIATLTLKPHLVILAACASAGDETGATLAALGPQLVRAGVPAVLAMQGRISRETLGRFLPACLQALLQNGQVDRAVATARAQVADRPDWWAPALWMRPGDGMLWSVPVVPVAPAGPAQALHQLRAPVADFVGRSAEVERLVAALRSATGGCAAISGVRGMGGVGKTELAHAVAAQLQHEYPDAQLLLELRGASDTPLSPVQALQHVIRAFRPEDKLPEDLPALQQLYRSVLSSQRVLILADDARDAVQVRPLLPPTGCALLVTSRQRFTLDGMSTLDLSRLDNAAAVTLLRRICVRLTEEQAQQIARLCGYLPLALRVSAGILLNDEALPVERYLNQLADQRQRLAHLKDPDDPTRDVAATLLLSYAALDVRTQMLFRHLGVIAADADLTVIAAVLELPEDETDKALRGLLRRSLVEYDATRGRWGMHDLVRSCALGLLAKADEEHAIQRRYAEQVIQTIQKADQHYQAGGDRVLEGLALFDRERSHLEAIREWLWTQSPTIDICNLVIAETRATANFSELRDSLQITRLPQLERALDAARKQNDRSAEANFLGKLGRAYSNIGEMQQAIIHLNQQLALAQDLGDNFEEGSALGNLGLIYRDLGEISKAIDYQYRHLAIAKEINNRREEGDVLGNLGIDYAMLGDLKCAIEFYGQQLVIAREIGDRHGEGRCLTNLGIAYRDLGNTQKALECHNMRLIIAQEVGYRRGEGHALTNLGVAYIDLKEYSEALDYHRQALSIIRDVSDKSKEVDILNQIGRILLHQDCPDEALIQSTQALVLARKIGDRRLEGITLHTIAAIHSKLDQYTLAHTNYTASLTILSELSNQTELARTRWSYGQFLVRQGDRTRGIDLMAQCVAYEQHIGHAQAEEHAALVKRLRAGGELPG